MGCSSCSTGTGKNGKPGGCKSNGGCSSGGCNKLNTYDWLSNIDIHDPNEFGIVEIMFKNGTRKGFYHNQHHTKAITGDQVVVETNGGYDIGEISLSGELVRLQMKKKKVIEDSIMHKVIRIANHRDLDRLHEARRKEKETMFKARAISRMLDLDMKIGDVEFQGDNRKATFFYTAEGRVDFRELIRHFAKEFKVKVEMRQIGARQESARIGGLGSCGRELCCSTWLTDFKSVTTSAARYQNLAINQSKLSGQCGRLKCCLNFELDSYMEALEAFPKNADRLRTEVGTANLVKTNIFKGIMYYFYEKQTGKSKMFALPIKRVKEILAMNVEKKYPIDLIDIASLMEEEETYDFEDVTGAVELPMEKRRKKRNNRNRNKNRRNKPQKDHSKTDQKTPKAKQQRKEGEGDKSKRNQGKRRVQNKKLDPKKQENRNVEKKKTNTQNKEHKKETPSEKKNTGPIKKKFKHKNRRKTASKSPNSTSTNKPTNNKDTDKNK